MTFKLQAWVALLTLATSAWAQEFLRGTGLEGLKNTTAAPQLTRYVVEFSEAGSAKFRKRDGAPDTEGFFEDIKLTSNDVTPGLNFTSDLFHGASFDVADGTETSIAEIESLPEVHKVYPVGFVYAPKPAKTDIRADGPDSELPAWNPHVFTRADAAHELGFDGRDVVVAVVDSGIDYTHPDLGGGFGKGFKVEGGWDFVGDAYDTAAPGVFYPDADPKDCMGHGTHVAGIVASSNKLLPGVAPKARLRAYKVFGCQDGTTEDVVAQAFIRAHDEGADIITASLGANNGFPDGLMAVMIQRITAKGTFVSAAAGNSGAHGPYFTSSLGNGHGSLTVGSVHHTQQIGWKMVARSSSGESREMFYISDSSMQWERNGTFKAYLPPVSRDYDFCRNPNEALKHKKIEDDEILILPRGRALVCGVTWQLMDSNLIGKAQWAMFYNYEGIQYERPSRVVYMENQAKGFAAINYEDGIWLEEQDEAGHALEFEFIYSPSSPTAVAVEDPIMDSFSSWGSTLDGRMKPEISAPGGDILSTYLVEEGGWAVLSGTSMATPYIAGVAALFFQSVGGRERAGENPAEAANRRIVASGAAVRHYSGDSAIGPVAHQGAGLVNALKVVSYQTTLSPSTIHLNDTANFQSSHRIVIHNSGAEPLSYSIHHEPGVTPLSRGLEDAWITLDPSVRTDKGAQATVIFSETNVTVPAKGSVSVDVTFAQPDDLSPVYLATYGGYIHVVGSNGEAVKATYMGIQGNLYDADIWETHRGVPVFLGNGIIFGDDYEFAWPTLPELYFNQLWSTREYSFELVKANYDPIRDWEYPLRPGRNNLIGTTMYYDPKTSQYYPFPLTNQFRPTGSVFRLVVGPRLAHGEDVKPGEYRILARALRTYGDYRNASDWQFRLSPRFVVPGPGSSMF